MYRIAVMGDKDSICGFSALGLDIFPTDDAAYAVETMRNLINNNYAVIYITEALAAIISDEIEKNRNKDIPAIILIPGIIGNTGIGLASVSKTIEKAVGSDIMN